MGQSGCIELEGVDDAKDFQQLTVAMDIIGLEGDKEIIFQILAG